MEILASSQFGRANRLGALLLAVALAWMSGCASTPGPVAKPEDGSALRLVRAYPVEGIGGAREPSGLTLQNGRLYAVCDKVDNTVFRIDIDNGVARMVPHIIFTPPPGGEPLDFEGITSDEDGYFYLASETYSRILRVSPSGEASWHFESVEPAARKAGLLLRHNAKLEGIALLPNGNFLLAAERHPRGLIEVDGQTGAVLHAQVMNSSIYSAELPLLRIPDWTGLFVFQERVFALFRNAHLVVPLGRHENGDFYEAAGARSFQHAEESSEYRYDVLRFGKAEGLAMDERFIYVVIDNNGRPRAIDRADKRPLLFVFENPFAESEPDSPVMAPFTLSGLLRR
ncbi:MAG: esterase-like activity of phytase family protein [Opitutales bacterium]|nr:esterase-like activity of phytase family protein [Opitutales bacterium]